MSEKNTQHTDEPAMSIKPKRRPSLPQILVGAGTALVLAGGITWVAVADPWSTTNAEPAAPTPTVVATTPAVTTTPAPAATINPGYVDVPRDAGPAVWPTPTPEQPAADPAAADPAAAAGQAPAGGKAGNSPTTPPKKSGSTGGSAGGSSSQSSGSDRAAQQAAAQAAAAQQAAAQAAAQAQAAADAKAAADAAAAQQAAAAKAAADKAAADKAAADKAAADAAKKTAESPAQIIAGFTAARNAAGLTTYSLSGHTCSINGYVSGYGANGLLNSPAHRALIMGDPYSAFAESTPLYPDKGMVTIAVYNCLAQG